MGFARISAYSGGNCFCCYFGGMFGIMVMERDLNGGDDMDGRDCGACCRVLMFYVDNSRETRLFYQARGLYIYGNIVCVPHTCSHLEGNTCKIYENRPTACKTFKVNGQMCKLCRKLADLGHE